MEMRKCDVCGEEYSATYRSCPFCEEQEAIRRGKPIHRHSSDFRNRRGGHALGVLALVLALVVIGAGAVGFFGENIAQALGMREPTNAEDGADQDAGSLPPSDSGADEPEDGVMPSADDSQGAEPENGGDSQPATPPSTPWREAVSSSAASMASLPFTTVYSPVLVSTFSAHQDSTWLSTVVILVETVTLTVN